MSNDSNKFSSFLKNSIIGALIIGIIGSALWEFFLRPFSTWLFEHVSQIIVLFSDRYLDEIYKMSSYGFKEHYSFYLFYFVAIAFDAFLIAVSFDVTINHPVVADALKKFKKRFCRNHSKPESVKNDISYLIQLNLLILITTFGIVFTMGKYEKVNWIISNSQRNIEIVSAYVSDQEYKLLKSEFHSMESESDYLLFCNHIKQICEKNNLDLKY